MKTIVTIYYLLIMVFILLGCKVEQNKIISIAVVVDETNETSEIGKSVKEGVKYANDISPQRINIIYFNDKNNSDLAKQIALRIASDPSIIGVIGHSSSGITSSAQDVYGRYKIPLIMPVATKPSITTKATEEGRKNILRVVPTHDLQSTVIVDYILNNLKKDRPMVLNDRSEYGLDLGQIIEKSFKNIGIDVPLRLTIDNITNNVTDYTSVVENIQRYKINVVVFAGYYSEASLLIKQIREAEINVPIVLTDGCFQNKMFDNLNPIYDSIFVAFISPQWENIKSAQGLINKIKEEFPNQDPSYAPFAADAYGIFKKAISLNEQNITRESILKTIKSQEFNYSGISGDYRFNQNGDWIGGSNYIYKLNIRKKSFIFIK